MKQKIYNPAFTRFIRNVALGGVIFLSVSFSSCLLKHKQAVLPNSIDNGNFETWDSLSYLIPQYALESSNPHSYVKCGGLFSCVRVNDPFTGTYALKLITGKGATDNYAGYFTNCHPNGRAPTWLGGVPYSEQPTGIQGYYKSSLPEGDSALILVSFKKGGKNIGYYALKLYGTHTTYTPFFFTFNPPLKTSADSMMFVAVSSDVSDSLITPNAGRWLQLDNISFTGVKSQPLMFDGDFEHWEKQTFSIPASLYFQSGHGEGISKTTDAYSGRYAMQLTTFQGDIDGTAVAEPEMAENGAWNNECRCFRQGQPFWNRVDTLAFYYKYSPALAADSANVSVTLRRGGSQLWYGLLKLGAAAEYKYVQLPFDAGQAPDTAVVQIQSSQLTDTAVGHIGSVLKIDDIGFRRGH